MRWFPNVLISCVCLFFAVQYSAAQSAVVEDKELARLVGVVKMLRNADEANFNKAQEVLKADQLWVAMSADEALQQIEDKQYAKPFEHDGRTVYKIGVNFSSQTRRIDGWKIQQQFTGMTD